MKLGHGIFMMIFDLETVDAENTAAATLAGGERFHIEPTTYLISN